MDERTLVAIMSLATSVEDEARALAAALGTLAYEERLKLNAGVPAIVLATHELGRAEALLAGIRARGHGALLVRCADIVPASAMVSLRRFQLDDRALVAGDARLPWSDVAVLVRVTHRRRTQSTEKVKEKKIDLGRAVATGGMLLRKTSTREVITRSDDSEPVLYLFRASGESPWILREQGTHFSGLGAELTPFAARNFALAVARVRASAPHARFDDRLLARKSSPDELDQLAYLVAQGDSI